MTYTLRVRPEAEADLREAFQWHEGQRPGLGADFLLCVEAALDAITLNPFQFPLLHREVRRALVRRFPYAVFFVVHDDTASVLAVFHCRRDPGLVRTRSKTA